MSPPVGHVGVGLEICICIKPQVTAIWTKARGPVLSRSGGCLLLDSPTHRNTPYGLCKLEQCVHPVQKLPLAPTVHRITSGPFCPSCLPFHYGLGYLLPCPQPQCQARPLLPPSHTCLGSFLPLHWLHKQTLESDGHGPITTVTLGSQFFLFLSLFLQYIKEWG